MSAISGMFKAIGAYVTGEALVEALDGVEDRIDRTTRKVIKAATLWLIFILGLFFVLWGLGLFLSDYFTLYQGAGLMLVGGFIIVLALLVKAFR